MWMPARPRCPEALLYRSGGIRKLGRVDHGDAFLDTESLEKTTRHHHPCPPGIRALRQSGPHLAGHTPATWTSPPKPNACCACSTTRSWWSPGTDGVQGHTETLWRLLARYQVPTFIFVNKMDAAGADKATALADLRRRLSDAVYELPMVALDSGASGSLPLIEAAQWRHAEDAENVATLDESAMDEYLETGGITLARAADHDRRTQAVPGILRLRPEA